MAHRFFKYSHNTSGLPGRIASMDRIIKKAHDVWSICEGDNSPVVTRLRTETVGARSDDKPSNINTGDVVLLLMGGKKSTCRVASISGSMLTLDTGNNESMSVPVEWTTKIADSNTEALNMVSDSIKRLLASRGGSCAIRLSPSTMMAISGNPDGNVQVRMFEVSTRQVHAGTYTSVDDMVREFNLVDYPDEIDSASLLKSK